MHVRNGRTKEGVMVAISKLGRRRQVVIPKAICERLGLHEGDFIEVRAEGSATTVNLKKVVRFDDVLAPEEEKLVCQGEAQLRRGEYVTLEQLEHDMVRQTRKGSRKTI
jgi:AbrB family looped-hinge helix DNA binding protein